MKSIKVLTIVAIAIVLTGCAAVPKQLVDAMEMQKQEIARVKKIYFENMNNQLDAIEKYRLAILDIYEDQYEDRIRKAPGTMKDSNGNIVETLVDPTGDDEIDVFNIELLKTIDDFFTKERDTVRADINIRREEIRKAEQNFENIEQINASVNEYLESLVRLKESQDKLAKSLRDNLAKLAPIPVSFSELPDPSSIENLIKKFKIE
jgi:hypothetical protein